MGKSSFREFVEREKKIDLQVKEVNWEEKKQLYLSRVDDLYKNIEAFLREFIESKAVRIERNAVNIDEEYIGEYDVPVLDIYLYNKHAALIPAGTNMIGSPGRVDLVCDYDVRRIILADKNEDKPQIFRAISHTEEEKEQAKKRGEEWIRRKRDYVWKFITDPPEIRYIDLTEDSFFNSLQEVLGG